MQYDVQYSNVTPANRERSPLVGLSNSADIPQTASYCLQVSRDHDDTHLDHLRLSRASLRPPKNVPTYAWELSLAVVGNHDRTCFEVTSYPLTCKLRRCQYAACQLSSKRVRNSELDAPHSHCRSCHTV